tara:strand:- start:404 stop:1177 length:774 start_codon:yes stop_codon:yes gene_type:complete
MKKIYIHIGNFKTASTSLQRFIYMNKNLFNKNNIEVLLERNFVKQSTNNMKLFKYFEQMNKVKIKKYFSKSLNYKNLLITSEYFSTFSNDIEKLAFLKNTFNNLGLKPIIIFYYRYDADYLYSFYAELLTHRKIIEIDSIFDFINKIKKWGYYFNIKNKKYFLSQKYFFNNRLISKNWRKIFKHNFHTIEFSKKRGNKVFYDFLKILKITNEINFKIPSKSNKTRKIKFWHLKRFFYFIYLKKLQKKLFKSKDLKIT